MDIVERLSKVTRPGAPIMDGMGYSRLAEPDPLSQEAATEITRLREEVEQYEKELQHSEFCVERYKAEAEKLREENKRMREALKPFAKRAGELDAKWLDHETHWSPEYGETAITIADLRRASIAMATTGGEASKLEPGSWF